MTRETPQFEGRPWSEIKLGQIKGVKAVPTMLAREEQQFYHWLARDWREGWGAIVDLGAFVGGSTARLASGVAASGKPGRVHAYDRFTADERTKARVLYGQGIAPFEGNDTLPLAKSLLAPWAEHIRFHRGQIEELGWDGGPIEILCVDAFKKTALTDIMAGQFFPALRPGSLIVQQDFLHWSQPWLCAQMLGLGDKVEPVVAVKQDTVAFLVHAPVEPADLARAAVAKLDDAALCDGVRRMQQRLSGWGLAKRFDRMIEGLRLNPGVRIAWQMKNVPGA